MNYAPDSAVAYTHRRLLDLAAAFTAEAKLNAGRARAFCAAADAGAEHLTEERHEAARMWLTQGQGFAKLAMHLLQLAPTLFRAMDGAQLAAITWESFTVEILATLGEVRTVQEAAAETWSLAACERVEQTRRLLERMGLIRWGQPEMFRLRLPSWSAKTRRAHA